MRYFKYPFINNVNKKVFKERLSRLSKKSKRNYYISKIVNFCNVVLYIILVSGFILLFKHISNDGNVNKVLQVLLQILDIICIIFIPALICIALSFYYTKLLPYDTLPKLERHAINQCRFSLE